MKNEGLLKFYKNAVRHSKSFAQLGRVLRCAEASSISSRQEDIVKHTVNRQRRVFRLRKVLSGGGVL